MRQCGRINVSILECCAPVLILCLVFVQLGRCAPAVQTVQESNTVLEANATEVKGVTFNDRSFPGAKRPRIPACTEHPPCRESCYSGYIDVSTGCPECSPVCPEPPQPMCRPEIDKTCYRGCFQWEHSNYCYSCNPYCSAYVGDFTEPRRFVV